MSDIRVSFPKPCDQQWDDMASEGCHRRCAQCDQTIFDLEKLTCEEAEALLANGVDACVRAKVAADGTVSLAKSRDSQNRAMKVALGTVATLALASCSSVGGSNVSPRFTVSGSVKQYQTYARLTLEGEGRRYKTRAKRDSSFRFSNLKPGTYRLSVTGYCGSRTEMGEFTLTEDDLSVGQIEWQETCIIVGKLERENPTSLGRSATRSSWKLSV
jgi:hypothetical protein